MNLNFFKKSVIASFTFTIAGSYFVQAQEVGNERDIEEIVLVGVADIAKHRKTPVAVSTIKETTIIEKLGNQEFPEILNNTPSVYATKAGGGFGDSRINIRGFNQRNIAVMVNGIPINDMLNGDVYWSNWTGISDVTSSMQVQRGLGASKLAIVSVGGTMNILTRSADKKKGGVVTLGLGNDGYHKSLFAYNTGKNLKGWSASFLMARTAGALYADGTDFEGYNYYFALGYQPNKIHDLQFTFTGAPQWHHQRGAAPTINEYINYGSGGYVPNRRYNKDWGYLTDKDGIAREYSLARNHYHKPIISLNWDWRMNSQSKLSTALYASFGRGGGTRASNNGKISRTAQGILDFDALVRLNSQAGIVNANNGSIRQVGGNSHDWYGILSSFQHKIGSNWKIDLGVDGRYFNGYRYNLVSDLLGATGFLDNSDLNNPNRVITKEYGAEPSWNPIVKVPSSKDRVTTNIEQQVLWYGAFGQVEYSNEKVSAFLQGAVSNQGFKRVDHYIREGQLSRATGEAMPQKTDFKYKLGYNVKGGVNYNINEQHNIFANVGYYEKQPFFTAIYRNSENAVYPNANNEKIFGVELGYGLKLGDLTANVNVYRTIWKDVFTTSGRIVDTDLAKTRYFAEINGIKEIHQGVEIDAEYKLGKVLSFTGMLSLGDWYYKGNAEASTLNGQTYQAYQVQGQTGTDFNLYLDGAKVGESAQFTTSLGAILEPVKNLKFDANWRYVDRLYASLDPMAFVSESKAKLGTLRLPSYNLLDLGLSYKLNIGNGQSFTLRGNVYNVFDTIYIAESRTNIHTDGTPSYKGINKKNQVFFGYGRTWSTSLSFNF